jgi:hypothetical protein
VGTGVFTSGVRRQELASNHSHPSSVEVKTAWSYASIPPIRFHGVVLRQKDNFKFLFFASLHELHYLNILLKIYLHLVHS